MNKLVNDIVHVIAVRNVYIFIDRKYYYIDCTSFSLFRVAQSLFFMWCVVDMFVFCSVFLRKLHSMTFNLRLLITP